MHRLTDCRAKQDYNLWLSFDDGLEGSLFLGGLLEVSAFSSWRDTEKFCKVSIDPDASSLVWENGIMLDPEPLYQELLSRR